MELQAPSVLAQLPRPLQGSTGKTQIGEVYSLSDARKRKRYEVAVAVDGEALNIYNVRMVFVSVMRLVLNRVYRSKHPSSLLPTQSRRSRRFLVAHAPCAGSSRTSPQSSDRLTVQ